ncbi:predicted protein [Naegleria gruberi]|uniref:protein-tyrosine-phosphatase n=1 Tax=Naegleria gruberi TaxID=5762 RepID=D2VCY8_NAEGR|nr:uncharacterized protein NAEGRDRAFT_60565 [Naegleria gruberi]EFC45386.1 predicted protein [Naegleria gruberi]|eukprot:XP_002678130.1 predicted protein [Naegleria gruberi strain NEG-M]
MTILVPPINFGYVQENVFRSGQPTSVNFPHLATLNLKTIIYLAPDQPTQEFVNFAKDQNINLIHLTNQSTKMKKSGTSSSHTGMAQLGLISEEIVVEALEIILNRENLPLAIMCNLGRHRTGTVVGCLRKIQRWNLTSILDEYRRYAGSKVRLQNEQFIELFDTDLVSFRTDNKPDWLYD